jgi:multicomponent Na+:H+ antiporter subunit D
MFMIAAHIAEGGTDEISKLGGIFRYNPLNGLAFSVAGLSLMGLPMFFGFAVKMNVLQNLFKADHMVLPAIILLASLVEGAYIIKMLVTLWNPGKEGEYSTNELVTDVVYPIKQVVCLATLLISLCLVVLGFVPDQVINGANLAGSDLKGNQSIYNITLEGGDN